MGEDKIGQDNPLTKLCSQLEGWFVTELYKIFGREFLWTSTHRVLSRFLGSVTVVGRQSRAKPCEPLSIWTKFCKRETLHAGRDEENECFVYVRVDAFFIA